MGVLGLRHGLLIEDTVILVNKGKSFILANGN
jgi:hypothetical protein